MIGNTIIIYPSSVEEKIVSIPGSKSHTIRALLLSLLSQEETKIENVLYSGDTESCIAVIENWGAKVTKQANTLLIDTTDVEQLNLKPKRKLVNVGNSGTTLFFATALAAISPHSLTFDGDESLRSRSAKNLIVALESLGAKITHSGNGCVPYTVAGPIRGGNVTIACPTSQYASALLYALSCVEEKSVVNPILDGERPYIDMTIEWLSKYGAEIVNTNYESIAINKGISRTSNKLRTTHINGDYSSASFFFAVAAITGIPMTLCGLSPNDTQADIKVLDILQAMGCSYEWKQENEEYKLTISRFDKLMGGEFDISEIPDALPVLAVVGSYAQTDLRLYNVAHARLKETDRIAVMAQELKNLGVSVSEQKDGLKVESSNGLQGGIVKSYKDHRIAMAFAVGAIKAQGPIVIQDADAVAVTFPSFYECLQHIGVHVDDNKKRHT